MKKFVIGLCIGLFVLSGTLLSVRLDASPYESPKVVHFEAEDGIAIEGVLYARGSRPGNGPNSGSGVTQSSNGHNGS